MLTVYYGSVLIAALLCAMIYIFIWHKHFDINFTMIFSLIPISCIGYLASSKVETTEGVVIAWQIIYIGGVFLQYFILMSIFNLCQIELSKWLRTMVFAVCVLTYLSVISIGYLDIFYKSISVELINGERVITKEYGFMHSFFYVLLAAFFIAGISTIIYSWKKKKDVPRGILILLVIPDVVCVFTHLVVRNIWINEIDFMPLGYLVAEIVYLLIAIRVNLYDISSTVIDSYVHEQKVGYLSCDFKRRYLGSNDIAKELIPALKTLAVDDKIEKNQGVKNIFHYIKSFKENENNNVFIYTVHDKNENEENDRYYNVNVNYLYDGNTRRGFIITLLDDTANRKYIRLIGDYNDKLQSEVTEKTKHIVEMHDNLIMSLAVMIESRDNSTGGHIKRTSEGVRILVDEINKLGTLNLSPEFCADVIKAAPMHDLGKIAVADDVLKKPGRFTDKEFEEMKKHAAEGAKVIHEILLNTDDESFKIIAENVAHYHHERWDGSGYPDGLKGEEIPLEARIMAIADVYDALVSKRVYKEAYDFEKADRIIEEGMGSQFDPELKSAYEKARPRLEKYYSGN